MNQEVLEFETAVGVTVRSSRWKNGLAAAALGLFDVMAVTAVVAVAAENKRSDLWLLLALGALVAASATLTVRIGARVFVPEALQLAAGGLTHRSLFGERTWAWTEIDRPHIVSSGYHGLFLGVQFEAQEPGRVRIVSLPLFWDRKPGEVAGMLAMARTHATAGGQRFVEAVDVARQMGAIMSPPPRWRRASFIIAAVFLAGYVVWMIVTGRF